VPRKPKFKRSKVSIDLIDRRNESWKFARKTVRGTVFSYDVRDENFPRIARWTFIVRVPRELVNDSYIEVRPTHTPRQRVFAGLDRRSINFAPARRTAYRGLVYGKVFLGDASGDKTKIGVAAGERPQLPQYISRRNMRLKKTVTLTAGSDGNAQVKLFKPSSHKSMIKFFLATRAWVLHDEFTLQPR
jgi:hypothetical protein